MQWQIAEVGPGAFARTGVFHPLQPNSGIIVGERGAVVVDSGYSTAAGRALLADVRRVTEQPVIAVIISHHHFDHAWGNEAFAGAEIIGHANAQRNMLADPAGYLAQMTRFAHQPAGWYGLEEAALIAEFDAMTLTPPTRTYADRETLDLGGQTVELLHLGPGHTDGDTLVYLPEARVLFGGDLICNHVLPNAADGDPLHWPAILAQVEAMPLDVIVPGHGPVGDRRTAGEFSSVLQTLRAEVQDAIDAGAPDPRAASAQLRLESYGDWSGHELLPATVRKVYRMLAAERDA